MREFENRAKDIVPALRLLRDQAVKCEEKYQDAEWVILQSTATRDLVKQMKTWAQHMNNASYRLSLEAKAIEFAYRRMCVVASEKEKMFEYIRHAILDMRFLHDRIYPHKVLESTATQTDDLETSIDVSTTYEINLWSTLYELQRRL